MSSSFLAYLVVGKILIFFSMKFVKDNKMFEGGFIGRLLRCDLCLGVWIYSPLAYLLGTSMTDLLPVGVVSSIITGMATSFVVHVFSAGWNTRFSTVVID